jgi:prophage antirepressor-like protein
MASNAIQATTAVTFRASGIKPSPVHVFADKGGRRWIVASDVCRILGLRTEAVPKLVPEQDRSHVTVLTQGRVQSVTIVSEGGFNVLVGQSSKAAAKVLHAWMVGEVLPAVVKAPAPKSREGQGELF